MLLIDAQIHVWSPDVSTRPWLPGTTPPAQGAACSAEQVLQVMDDAGVARTVLVSSARATASGSPVAPAPNGWGWKI